MQVSRTEPARRNEREKQTTIEELEETDNDRGIEREKETVK